MVPIDFHAQFNLLQFIKKSVISPKIIIVHNKKIILRNATIIPTFMYTKTIVADHITEDCREDRTIEVEFSDRPYSPQVPAT